MTRHRVCRVDEVAGNVMLPVAMGRGTILLTRLPSGEIKAIASRCPHQGANLVHGCVTGHAYSDQPNVLSMEMLPWKLGREPPPRSPGYPMWSQSVRPFQLES